MSEDKDKPLSIEEYFASSSEEDQISMLIEAIIFDLKDRYGEKETECLTAEGILENYEEFIGAVKDMIKQNYMQLEFIIDNKRFVTNKINLPKGVINIYDYYIKEVRNNVFQLFPDKSED